MSGLTDRYGRRIVDLRLSVTDRCNYKCVYCRTGKTGAQYDELTWPDYLRIARLFVRLGIEKVRITGGEPLLRRGIVSFVRELKELRTSTGDAPELTLTTNGHLLADMVPELKEAGLRRVTVSMDALDSENFTRMTGISNGHEAVLRGVRAARDKGLAPVKVNCVLLRGFNDGQILPFVRFAREEELVVRFIEFMPLGEGRAWSPDLVVPLEEILARIRDVFPLHEIPHIPSETARRYRFDDGVGEIGIIAPVSKPFCGQCSRVRLTSDGKIRTCLFSTFEHDLAGQMRRGAGDDELLDWIAAVMMTKEERHHIGEPGFQRASRTMVHIGG